MQVFDPGYRATRKFLKEAPKYLKKDGILLIGFSSDLGHGELLQEIARDENLTLEEVAKHEMKETESVTFELLKGIYK